MRKIAYRGKWKLRTCLKLSAVRYFAPMSSRADRIKERLQALGLSERAASLKAGLSPRFVNDLLKFPDMSPRADTLQKLAEALETSADWIERGVDVQAVDKHTAEIIGIMGHLNARARKRILEMAKTEERLAREEK